MCGIVGWLGPDIDPKQAFYMRDKLQHRGPDDAGFWQDDKMNVWLGHRRLAVLDLSHAGRQPMCSPCGRFVLVFNGEIYNYRLLRRMLKAEGVVFKGESDTEVLLMACIAWGVEKAVGRFEGMFAFALYDRLQRRLWLARDPMGIKPVYYAHQGGQFAFSSELLPLLQLSWVDHSIDQSALYYYFRYLCVPSPASIIKGVRKLESGSLLRFDGDDVTVFRYWDLRERALSAKKFSRQMSMNEAADELEHRLKESVKLHMQSDVPYGAFLSGGVDSSTIVALMQAASTKPIRTFSIGIAEHTHDESTYAKAIAEYLGTDHHELRLSAEEIPELVPEVIKLYDEPFADNSAIPTYLVSKFARESVTVCLSGDGGDELFGGYPRYFWGKRLEQLRKWLTPVGAKGLAALLEMVPDSLWDRVIDPILGYRVSGAKGLAYRVHRFAGYLECDRRMCYARAMSTWADPGQLLGFNPDIAIGPEALSFPELRWSEEMMLIDQLNYLQDDILTKVDRASMAVSLEARVPLLIQPLVEWSWQIDSSLKLAEVGDRGKLVLREVLYRYVPKELIERPKQGFGLPMTKWLRGSLREWAESLLAPSDLEDSGLRPDIVRKAWDEHQSGQDRATMLWTVMTYRQWFCRVYEEGA